MCISDSSLHFNNHSDEVYFLRNGKDFEHYIVKIETCLKVQQSSLFIGTKFHKLSINIISVCDSYLFLNHVVFRITILLNMVVNIVLNKSPLEFIDSAAMLLFSVGYFFLKHTSKASVKLYINDKTFSSLA